MTAVLWLVIVTPISSQAPAIPTSSRALSDSLTSAQITKTKLEITRLQHEEQLQQSQLALIISLSTAGLAVLGALAGLVRYFYERRREGRSRFEERVKRNLERLIAFPAAEGRPVSQAILLLQDLSILLNAESERIRPTTVLLSEVVTTDCDLSNRRHAEFDDTVVENWPDYSRYLVEQLDTLQFILYKYQRALAFLHDSEPTYFERIHYDRTNTIFVVKEYTLEARHLHFLALLNGYRSHVRLLPETSQLRTDAIREFRRALKNARLTEELFGSDSAFSER